MKLKFTSLSLLLLIVGCEPMEDLVPRRDANNALQCSNVKGLGVDYVKKVRERMSLAWSDEFNGPEDDKSPVSCFDQQPKCGIHDPYTPLRSCRISDPSKIRHLNKCNWIVQDGFNFMTSGKTSNPQGEAWDNAFSPDHVQVSNGVLRLTAEYTVSGSQIKNPRKCGQNIWDQRDKTNVWSEDCPMLSGGIASAPMSEQGFKGYKSRFGLYETRARWITAKHGWPAIWMVQNEGWPKNGEIDIIEAWAESGKSKVLMSVHSVRKEDLVKEGKLLDLNDDETYSKSFFSPSYSSDEWHTYQVLWKEDKVQFFIDGCHIDDINSRDAFHVPNTADMFLFINLSMQNSKAISAAGKSESWLEVDWIRHYK